MTPQFLSTDLAWWVPVMAAAGDTSDLVLKALNLGAVGIGMYLLVRGDLRLKREVEASEARVAEALAQSAREVAAADNRTAVERARADRHEEAVERMQKAVLDDLAPGILKVSTAAEQLAKEQASNSELMEGLIRAVVRVVERQP
jgi:hypothetical protein